MSAARGRLDVEQPGHPPSRLLLTDTVVRIGRAKENQLQIPDGHVSKLHAEIRSEFGAHVVVDVGSLAGVLVNGAKVMRHTLADGDVVELGATSPVRLTYRREDEPQIGMTTLGVVADEGEAGMARLARFFEFSNKLGGGFAIDEVLRDVVDLAIEITKAERGFVILRRDGGALDTRIARATGGRALPTEGLRVSETLVQKALASSKPGVFEDVAQDADLAIAASIVSLEVRSAVTLPLVRFETRGQHETATPVVFGLVYLDSRRQRRGFDGFDLGILERLARDASAVIENARLLREAEEQRRVAQELRMAREVQAALMPEQFRSTPAFAIAGTCVPCHELGGDYVDQFDLGGGRVALVVADVCGKGIAASLLAAALQGALAAEIVQGRELGEAIAHVNRVHCRLAPVGKFITMAIAVLEPDGRVALVNAGHCPVLHLRAGSVSPITTGGMALGLDADFQFEAVVLTLRPGDALVMYTDGVIECENGSRELFGDERLADVARQNAAGGADALLAGLVAEVERFRGEAAVNDDLSIVVAARR